MVVIIGVCLCLIELRYLSGRNGVRSRDNPLEGFREVIEPYTEKRNNLLKALREFAHKEFQ
jgi:hypothetical protein